MTLQCRMLAWSISVNGNDRGLIHIHSLNSPTGTEDISVEIQTNDPLNTSLIIMLYRSVNPLGDPYPEPDYTISLKSIFLPQRVDPLLDNDRRQTRSRGNEQTRNNIRTVFSMWSVPRSYKRGTRLDPVSESYPMPGGITGPPCSWGI
jgi:hypothetical protein